jgi:hypothetical protein
MGCIDLNHPAFSSKSGLPLMSEEFSHFFPRMNRGKTGISYANSPFFCCMMDKKEWPVGSLMGWGFFVTTEGLLAFIHCRANRATNGA